MSSKQRITQALARLFERHRIIFWYDPKQELHDDFASLELPDITKLHLSNNQYGVKYRLLREEPEQKFLLYHAGPQPADRDNWLLDVQLAHGEFRTDQTSLWLSELELGLEFSDVVEQHLEFFQAAKRREALKKRLDPQDTSGQICLKMLAVCAGSEPRIDAVVENLLQELADRLDDKIKLIGRCHLDQFLWERLSRHYEYTSWEKSIKDFQIRIFQDCYEMSVDPDKYLEIRNQGRKPKQEEKPKKAEKGETPEKEKAHITRMSQEILVFLRRWKDSRQFEKGFETLSDESAEVLGIEQDLDRRDFRELIELDYFRLVDKKIICDLVQAVSSRTVSSADVTLWVRQRRQSHWYQEYRHLYEAIDYAARLIHTLGESQFSMDSLGDGVQRYSSSWYQIDQCYRKFTYHVGKSSQASLMGALAEQIENLYTNTYLLKLGDRFQSFVDEAIRWEAFPVQKQNEFFEHWVQPFLRKENKVCVIISDAMRYEIGKELLTLIQQEDRYNAHIEPMLSMLPSYTQLGMAALLPNQKLAVDNNEHGTVLVDGQSSQGTENRLKILSQAMEQRVTVCKAKDVMEMKGDECRAWVRDHDLIYVYHNHIDATGDKLASEGRVFDAVEDTLQELILLIKKLVSANTNNLLVTSDHGFIYQNRTIEESDFSGAEATGEQVLYSNRRFVLGKGLHEASGLRKFTSEQLGLVGDVEVQIPKSINRLRQRGSGSRFVHGGASLQEVVVPVLKINKKRQSDVTTVEVEIQRGLSSPITSNEFVVTMYQSGPVTDKVHPRILRAGIYTESGDLISDSHNLVFDRTSENPRDREVQVRFVLTRKADEANRQEVILKLEEKLAGTAHFKEYKALRYSMRRSFTNDFDF